MIEDIDCDAVTKVVRKIFMATRTQPPETFQEYALEEVKGLIPFDSCKWGSGVILNGQAVIHNVHLHNLPGDNLDIYRSYQDQDAILAKMIATRDRVVTYDRYEITPREQFIELPLYKEYSQKIGLEQLISTMVPDPISNLFSVVSLARKDIDHPFSECEKRIKTIITPVLTEARSNNIFINTIRNTPELRQFRAICDAHGLLREAEPDFIELMQEEWPDWQGPRLNFVPEGIFDDNRTAYLEGKKVCINVSTFHDLLLLEARRKPTLYGLTKAEKKVTTFLLKGLTNKEIARELEISPKTVGNHLQRIYKKTGMANRNRVIARLGGHTKAPFQ